METNIDEILNTVNAPQAETVVTQNNVALPDAAITSKDSANEEDNITQDLTDEEFNDFFTELGYSDGTSTAVSTDSNTQSEEFDPDEVAEILSPSISIAPRNPTTSETENREDASSDNETNEDREDEEDNENEPIPTNSQTLLMDDYTSRFSGTSWYEEIQKAKVILAGLGGIGSWTALNIARLHPSMLVMYDNDIVDASNMSGQLYSKKDVGKAKVNAMNAMITDYTSMTNSFAINEQFNAQEAGGIMICGFDSMRARRTFFEKWLSHIETLPENKRRECLYIDGRLSIDTLQIFAITGDDLYNIELYKKEYLFYDYEADRTVCSLKQTSYMACMIGAMITNLFTNFVANLLNPIIPYKVPFFTEYDSQHMIFKIQS